MENTPVKQPPAQPSATVPGGNIPAGQTVMTDRMVVCGRIWRKIYRALDYLSLYLFIIVVYGGALLTDYALFSLMWWLISGDASKYPLVAEGLDYARIGLALLFLVSAVVHGIISTISQIRFDLETVRSEKKTQ